jgi:hypothetical protein
LGAQCSNDNPNKADVSQGWTEAQRIAWYTTSQGSRLIPQAWLHALEQPDQTAAFLDPAYIASFRYLPSNSAGWTSPNPQCPLDPSLPLGFTVDCQSDSDLRVTKLQWKSGQSDREPWVGMNCSACHTAQLTFKGQTFRFEGGPTLADFQGFTGAIEKALANTLSDPAKLGRFTGKVLGPNPAPGDPEKLKAALASLVDWNAKLARLNFASIRYGFGRLDAIGHIFNKVALEAMPDNAADQVANPSDAPVSYPFLWNVTQLDKVEWNGISANKPFGTGTGRDFDYGAVGRNTGEVIGVFADITVKPSPGLAGYKSSIDLVSLVGMEEQLQMLQPPKWPAAFGAINQELAKTGSDLFKSKHCDSCHAVPAANFSMADKYTVTLTKVSSDDPNDHAVGTDMWMACNAVFDTAKSGAFAGTPLDILGGTATGPTSDNLALVQTAVIGGLLGKKGDLVATAFEGIFGINRGLPLPTLQGYTEADLKEIRRNQCVYAQKHKDNPKSAAIVYKGRPLQGIWATAPYLHNGSVPTLWDLLLPAAQRPAVFYTGAREFDPDKVGLRTEKSPDNSFEFDARDKTGAPVDGNSNDGHDYGNATLSDDDRKALVEYMKTL